MGGGTAEAHLSATFEDILVHECADAATTISRGDTGEAEVDLTTGFAADQIEAHHVAWRVCGEALVDKDVVAAGESAFDPLDVAGVGESIVGRCGSR